MEKGLIHIYCGNGKGKTTAAMGLAVRMAGYGGKTAVLQFLKCNTSSERKALAKIENICLINGMDNVKFTFCMNDAERCEAQKFYAQRLEEIKQLIYSDSYELIVLDEALDAAECGIISEDSLLDIIRLCKGRVELVLTGRTPSEKINAEADYITEMKNMRHPYEKGMPAREGIEL